MQFTEMIDVAQMFIDSSNIHIKQRSNQLLRQPDSLILNTHFNAVFPGLPGKNQGFGGAVSDVDVFHFAHGIFSLICC
ncbi:MAG: hypothetical protein M0023_09890 [Desulfobacteraceae bacterium]|nr:hypothetical protein [Desulfobacteraceae bacterium]